MKENVLKLSNSALLRYLLFMKMAALQLMQQKANKDSKTDLPAITDVSENPPSSDSTADSTQTPDAAVATEEVKDNGAADPAEPGQEENSSKPTTNGPGDFGVTQNGECKSPLAGKELEESIPGLAQAKELAETLVAEDGSCVGMLKKTSKAFSLDDAGGTTLVDGDTLKQSGVVKGFPKCFKPRRIFYISKIQ